MPWIKIRDQSPQREEGELSIGMLSDLFQSVIAIRHMKYTFLFVSTA